MDTNINNKNTTTNMEEDGGAMSMVAMIIVSGIVVATTILLMLSSFTFGHGVVGGYMMSDVLGEKFSAISSGTMSVMLFDGGYVGALLSLAFLASNNKQRAVLLFQSVCSFLLSLSASIVSLALLSNFSSGFSVEQAEFAQLAGFITMMFALALNAFSLFMCIITSDLIWGFIFGGSGAKAPSLKKKLVKQKSATVKIKSTKSKPEEKPVPVSVGK